MATATKFRKDLSAEDFRIVCRFKAHMLFLIKVGKIPDSEGILHAGYVQEWYKSGGWKPNRLIKKTDIPCYRLTMQEFRGVIKEVATDIATVKEGLVIDVFQRCSLFLLDQQGNWKWRSGNIVLERGRFSPEHTLRPRNPDTARARLDRFHEQNIGTWLDDPNCRAESLEECSQDYFEFLAECSGSWEGAAKLQELEREVAEAQSRKSLKRAEVDKRISERKGLKNK